MRTAQELQNDLISRMKNAMAQAAPAEPVARSNEIIPGTRYRDERGRMVLIIAASQLRVKFYREGFSGVYETSRREFDMKFRKVQG